MKPAATRRDALLMSLGAAAALPAAALDARVPGKAGGDENAGGASRAAEGIEGQRRADLGNGTYLNPVLAGDHPDPSILKDGDVYYKVSSSFDYYPGLVLWTSRDLVNWTPVGPALHTPIGSVFAPDLAKHDGRYFIYFAALNADIANPFSGAPGPYGKAPVIANYVIHADHPGGAWSDPIDLGVRTIDPGHAVGEDGKRYLFFADGNRIRLSDDGLKTVGKLEKVYDGWPIPQGWVIEGVALEGPKVLRRDGWFYLFAAEGGTAGPPTGHMVIVARSRSIHGPWENCPHNPIVRTRSVGEPWWSRGHATPVEGPNGDWWLIYHGYENGFRTLGRQMLLESMTWTSDGWPVAQGGDLSKPLRKPVPRSSGTHGLALSDSFEVGHFGTRFSFFLPGEDYRARAKVAGSALELVAVGAKPADSTLLLLGAGDHRYTLTTEIALSDGAFGGITLFYDKKVFCALAASEKRLKLYRLGTEAVFAQPGPAVGSRVFLRVLNDANIATFFVSGDGAAWRTVGSFEVSGYNHNVFDGFLGLRPGIFAMGTGVARFKSLTYRAGGAIA